MAFETGIPWCHPMGIITPFLVEQNMAETTGQQSITNFIQLYLLL
jgi:hypothetical protein